MTNLTFERLFQLKYLVKEDEGESELTPENIIRSSFSKLSLEQLIRSRFPEVIFNDPYDLLCEYRTFKLAIQKKKGEPGSEQERDWLLAKQWHDFYEPVVMAIDEYYQQQGC